MSNEEETERLIHQRQANAVGLATTGGFGAGFLPQVILGRGSVSFVVGLAAALVFGWIATWWLPSVPYMMTEWQEEEYLREDGDLDE